MGIKDFLKNIFKSEEKPEPIKIEFSNLNNFLKDKEQQNQSENHRFIELTNQIVLNLIKELNPQIQRLKNIDLTEKKAEEKIKLITKQNLDNYINHLNKLSTSLKNITANSPQSLTNQINSVFNNFQKNSNTNFQKSTFLIGKELEDTVNTLVSFSKNFKNLQQENSELILTNKTIYQIKSELNNYKETKEIKDSINNNLINLKSQSTNLKGKIALLKKDLKEIKQSEEYNQELEEQQAIEIKKQNSEEEINSLKQLIDFKELANIYHANEKEMNIIKEYKENFQRAFEKDKGSSLLDIINFLQKTNMNKQTITKKAEQITETKNKIKNLEDNLELKQHILITIKQSEIEKINSQIQDPIIQISKEKKRLEKIQTNLQKIKNIIGQHLVKINVKLIYYP